MAEEIPAEVRQARLDISHLRTERDGLLREAARSGGLDRANLDDIDKQIGARLDEVLHLFDPCDASEAIPLVLLPVRLETRFGVKGGQTTLRVRIYPDEIHVDDLARGLTDEETAAAKGYWTSVWADPVPEAAWSDLVAAVGSDRAEWVAHVSTPNNLDARGTGVTPAFPQVPGRGPRNVIARALPDRFVAVAVQAGQVSQGLGKPIPPDLALSPIALEGDTLERPEEALAVPPGSEWLVDFEAAVDVGMAVEFILDGGQTPISRLVVMGTRASLSPAQSANEVEDLFAGHRYGAGLDLLPQGTPTNNSDAGRSPYRPRTNPVAPPLTPPEARPGSDTMAAAGALGIDPAVLTGLVGDGTGEQAVARHMNSALWAPGWGEYLTRLEQQGVPGVVDSQRESARDLFRDHVRGRGVVPAIRVGAQPYGVVPVSNLREWVPRAGETTAGVVHVVRSLLDRWLIAAVRNVPRIRHGLPNIDQVILDVLGHGPVMQGLRVRPVITDDVSDAVIAALGLDKSTYQAEQTATTAVLAILLGSSASKAMVGSLHQDSRPLPLPLASDRDPEFVEALLGSPSRVLAVNSVLQALLALAWQSSELDVAQAAPATVLSELVDFVQLDPDLQSRAAAMVARADTATVEELHGMVAELQGAGVTVGGTSMLRDFQPVEQIQTSLAEVALSAPVTEQSLSVASAALAGWLLAMGYRGEVRASMQALAKSGTAERRLAVAETIDCCSHRLDAWATAVVSDRRARQSGGGDAAGVRGLTIGAYGVVEDLSPESGGSADGWIHAPSPQHAIAAGMLRSSHLSHLPASAGAGDGPFAIDLSSRRMQSAAHVIEGVAQGQQIGALVGYQIERRLGEARLARLQLSLRTLAPLVARRLHDFDGADPQASRESVAANNVVDGVLLLKKFVPGDVTLRGALDAPPENAYLDPGDWDRLTDAEWTTVTRILREAADTIDATADVMLSESVLQFAGGNPHRAAAAMDAMSTGASPSDTIDVLEAQDSGERLNHRVLAVVAADLPVSPWNAVRPRAQVEPALEAWAAAHLGDPAAVVLAEVDGQRITLDAAGLCALDVVFATDPAGLDRTLRTAVPDLADAALTSTRADSWPKSLRGLGQLLALSATLRAIIAGSHPLLPLDLTRPGEQATRTLESALAELSGRVTGLAASLRSTVNGLEGTVAAIPADGIVAEEATAEALASAALRLEPYAIALTPVAGLPLDVSWVRDAWQSAQARSLAADAAVSRLEVLPADTAASLVLDAAQEVAGTVYGDGFLVVPALPPGAVPDGFVVASGDPAFAAPAATSVRRLVRDLGTVRKQVSRLSEALLIDGALGHPRTLEVRQLTERDESGPAAGTTHWLAGLLPSAGPWPASSVAHLLVDQVGDVDETSTVAGLVIDAWVEDLPAQVGPKADPDDPRPGRARTGLAIRCNSASARPPQAVLCAVSPDGKRWTTDSLRGVIEQTMELAKIRMVGLEHLAGEGLVLPALYTRSSSLQGQQYLQFAKLKDQASVYVAMPFVKEMS